MSETQSYKTVTFTSAQAVEVKIALTLHIEKLRSRIAAARHEDVKRELTMFMIESGKALDLLNQAPLSAGMKS